MCFRCYIQIPHTSIFTFTRWRPSAGNIHVNIYISGTKINNCSLFSSLSAHLRVSRNFAYLDASTRCLLFFFFFYLVWWHLTLILETPRCRPDHITPTALLSGSCVSCWVGAHAWSRTSLKVSLSLFYRNAYITLARTVCRRNRTVPFEISNSCSDLGRARHKRDIDSIVPGFHSSTSFGSFTIAKNITSRIAPKSLPEPILHVI